MVVYGAKISTTKAEASLIELMSEYSPDMLNDAIADVGQDPVAIKGWLEGYCGDAGGGVVGYLADIINGEENMCFLASDECNCIYVEQGFPWEIPEYMRDVSPEAIQKIADKYLSPFVADKNFDYIVIEEEEN